MAKMRNNLDRQMTDFWARRQRAYMAMLLEAADDIAARVREGYSGITRMGVDTGGWREGKAPVDHGHLRQSVRVDATRLAYFTMVILLGKEYAAYVEFGTSEVPGRPFLREAIRIEAPWARSRVRRIE